MKLNLSHVVDNTRTYLGLLRKRPIEEVYTKLILGGQPGPQLPNYGDDAAVIPWKDGYLLLAADGMMTRLLVNEPYAAGKASVMVTVNDIYAMGGRPLAMVNVLASGDDAHRSKLIDGIRKGCEKLGVPMVGGHLHPDAPVDAPSLSVAILGHATKLLRSHLAAIGDDLIFAADLDGQVGCHSVVSWDANSGKTSEQLIHRLEALPLIAENGWAQACKDVSNAGLLGTLSIMMENSGRGADIDLDGVPCPPELDLLDWMVSFQSFGFILSVKPENSPSVIDLFRQRQIHAAVVGRVTDHRHVTIRSGPDSKTVFDFTRDKITGITRPLETVDSTTHDQVTFYERRKRVENEWSYKGLTVKDGLKPGSEHFQYFFIVSEGEQKKCNYCVWIEDEVLSQFHPTADFKAIFEAYRGDWCKWVKEKIDRKDYRNVVLKFDQEGHKEFDLKKMDKKLRIE